MSRPCPDPVPVNGPRVSSVTPFLPAGLLRQAWLGPLLLLVGLPAGVMLDAWEAPRHASQVSGAAWLPGLPVTLHAQEGAEGRRTVVFNEVSVSGQGATITLEFEGGDRTTLELREGVVRIDGAEAGRYTPGDALDRGWRALLGEAITADNGAVATLLADWSPPSGLSGAARDAASALASSLEASLRAPSAPDAARLPAGLGAMDAATERSLLGLLIRRPELAPGMARLLEGADLGVLDVRAGSDVRIEAGERVEGSLLVLDGDLRVEGVLEGDAFVLNGTLRLVDEGRILGTARVAEGEFRGREDAVGQGLVSLSPPAPPERPDPPSVTDIRREIEQGIRDGMRDASTTSTRSRSGNRFFRNLVSGVGDILQTVVSLAILLAMGMGILYFFPRHFEVVARTAGHAPGRSLATGWAAILLSPVVWIFGIVFLTATIVGIPVMVAWLPLFWVAVAAGTLLGFLALARNLGAWWVHRRDAYHPQGIDTEQPAARLGIGLALLLAPFAVAGIFQMGGGLFSIFRGLALGVGILVSMNVAAAGLGAVLLSRAGRDRRWSGPLDDLGYGEDPFGPYEPVGPDEPVASPAGTGTAEAGDPFSSEAGHGDR